MQKKGIFILLLLIIGICAISTASAADDTADIIASDDGADVVATDEANIDDVAISDDEDLEKTEANFEDTEKLATSQDDSQLSVDESTEILSLPANMYTIKLEDEYEISAHEVGKIRYYREPAPSYMTTEPYHYYVIVLDANSNIHYNREVKGTNNWDNGYYTHQIPKDSINPGTYAIVFVNYDDANILDKAVLKVKGTAVITPSNYNSKYMSGAQMTAKVTEQGTGKALTALSIKAVFTKGKTSVTKYYTPNANGQISFVPPVGVGTWTVKFSPGESHIAGSAVKTITIKKSSVKVKAKNVKEYKGFKTVLKATVKANGKNVNEGKVQFKINGKKYSAKVKNGVATKKVKLKKIKKYKYTAKYLGNSNLYKSKKVKAKAVLKKRVKTKIIVKDKSVYTGARKKVVIKVLTKSGKKVKGGKIKIKSRGKTTYGPVKKGKSLAYATGLNIMDHFKRFTNNGETYKKSITTKVKIKYIPASHKYKASKTTAKVTSKFKCTCGKTSTHYHYTYGYYYVYKYKIAIV